jgi:hypothetical protein
MSKIEIYADYEAFEDRQDKSVNGVSKEWLDKHSLAIEELKLVNCSGCWNCTRCWNCKDCKDCIDCISCRDCISCVDGWGCRDCIDCIDSL